MRSDHLSGVSRLPDPVPVRAVLPSPSQATMALANPEPYPPVGALSGFTQVEHCSSGLSVNHRVAAAVSGSAVTPPASSLPDPVVP